MEKKYVWPHRLWSWQQGRPATWAEEYGKQYMEAQQQSHAGGLCSLEVLSLSANRYDVSLT